MGNLLVILICSFRKEWQFNDFALQTQVANVCFNRCLVLTEEADSLLVAYLSSIRAKNNRKGLLSAKKTGTYLTYKFYHFNKIPF